MKKNEFNQGVSLKVFAHDHVRSDATNTLYLRVTIARKKREFNLKVSWPVIFFDALKQEALPRHSKDKEVENVNMVINEAKGRANRIKLRYFSESKALTLDLFQAEFENYESRDNFLFYYTNKIMYRYGKGEISKPTMVRQHSNYIRFKTFLGLEVFSMANITGELVAEYQNWLKKKKKLKHNTVINALKGLKVYINAAIEDGFKIEDPFKKIKLSYRPGDREALDRVELAALRKLLKSPELLPTEREVLRKFLFSCFTGLRISDSAIVTSGMIRDNTLKIALVKGRRYGKEVSIPLPEFATEIIGTRKGVLFDSVADQTCNDWLKVIAHKAKIKKRLTFHVSRDTFATLFIELGGDVFTLKEILGHSSINTTQIYVKMSDKRKEQMMGNFNQL